MLVLEFFQVHEDSFQVAERIGQDFIWEILNEKSRVVLENKVLKLLVMLEELVPSLMSGNLDILEF